MSSPTLLSVFSGFGGMDLGFSRAGFETIDCIEIEPDAVESIRLNRPGLAHIAPVDINEICASDYRKSLGLRRKELDVLAAGPPCQPFSSAGRWTDRGWRGLQDPRAECLVSFLNLVDEFLPKVLVIENVLGFLRGETSAASLLKRAFDDINSRNKTLYDLHWEEVDAADFGVPQRRRRAIIVATSDGKLFKWPQASHRDTPVRAFDALRDVRIADKPTATGKWAKLLPSIPEGQNYLWHTARGGGKNLFGYRTRYWSFLLKLAKNKPSWTLSAQPGPSTGPFHWENRPLAIEEALRLQSFPASYKVYGTRRSCLLQVGNATPPLLAEVLGRQIGEERFDLSYAKPPTLRIARARCVPAPDRVAAVPKKYASHHGNPFCASGIRAGPEAENRIRLDRQG